MITVAVVYALPERQRVIELQVEDDCSVLTAAQRSGIAQEFSEIDLSAAKFGIFGKLIDQPENAMLKQGDRVEIYRPLIADPKAVRRERAQRQKKS